MLHPLIESIFILAIDCGDLEIANAVIKGANTTYKSIKRISCQDGYQLIGNSAVECLQSGTWSKLPSCRGKQNVFSKLYSIRAFSSISMHS